MQKQLILLITLLLAIPYSLNAQIIPAPLNLQRTEGNFDLSAWIISNETFSEDELEVYRNYTHRTTSLPLVLTQGAEGVNVQMHQLPAQSELTDYYELTVNEQGVKIGFTTPASRLYAWISMVQLLEGSGSHFSIPFCQIKDAPAFDWRGLHLDVARHFFTVEEVKRYIDLMAFYKFNTFHWHLTDDQGWRIEIKKYPLLTQIGAYRDSTIVGHYNANPRVWEHEHYGGYYTQDEIREVIEYAALRHVQVIPEIEMPGHSRAALAAYPNLSCTGVKQPVPGLWGIFDDIYCSRLETINFLKDVLEEVIELFPSDYIHIGGDEAPKTRWEKCPDCKQVMQEHGLKNTHELQSYFIREMDEFLTSKGKKLIGWDEILEGGLSPNAAVMSWRGTEGGLEAASQDHFVVMSPTSHCYFDYYQSGSTFEPLAIGGYLPLQKVYSYNPIPAGLEKKDYILGGQANLWTEYIPDFKQVEYMMYPRALAMSQDVWSSNKPGYAAFIADFRNHHEAILQRWEVNYSRSVYYPEIRMQTAKNGVNVRLNGIDSLQHFQVFMKEKGNAAMNSRIVMGANDSLFLERTEPGKQREISISISGEEFPGNLQQTFVLHNALGMPVHLITPPNEKYSNGGALTLTDGIRGDRPWKGSQWLGFNEKQVIVELDLQEIHSVASATVGLLDAKGSWIYLPQSIEVAYSKDGRRWKSLGTFDLNDENQELPIHCKAGQLRFTLKALDAIPDGAEGAGYIPWTFIDEIQVILEE